MDSLKTMPNPQTEVKRVILRNLPKSLVRRVDVIGSVSRNKEKPDRDIELFIQVDSAQDQKTLKKSIENLSIECLEIFGNRVAPYILTKRQYNEKKDLDVIGELEKGIQLHGSASLTTSSNGRVKS